MTKRASITGVTRRDGAYLPQLLPRKACEVHRIIRRSLHLGVVDHRLRWLGIAERMKLHDACLSDLSSPINPSWKFSPEHGGGAVRVVRMGRPSVGQAGRCRLAVAPRRGRQPAMFKMPPLG